MEKPLADLPVHDIISHTWRLTGTITEHNHSAFERICLVILYPVKFTVKLWTANEDIAGSFDDFLQAGASALEVPLCRQKRTFIASQQTLRVWNAFGLLVRVRVVYLALLLLQVILRIQPEGYGAVNYMFWVPGPYRNFASLVSHHTVL